MSFRRFIVPISLITIGFLSNSGIAAIQQEQTTQSEQGIIFYTNVTPTTTPQGDTIPDAFAPAVIRTSEDCTCNNLINNQSLHFTIFHPPVPENLNCSNICQTLSASSNPFDTLYELLTPSPTPTPEDQTENDGNRPEDAFAEPSPNPTPTESEIPACGNNVLDPGETCDDGNTYEGDGCSPTCQVEFCGDTVINNNGTEQCDDGNTTAGDGCDSTCTIESTPMPTVEEPTPEPVIELPTTQPTFEQPTPEPVIELPTTQPAFEQPTPMPSPTPISTPTPQISSQHQQCACTVTLGQQTFTRPAHEIFSPPIPMDQCNQARCITECSAELLMEISSTQ